jgi:anti-sigma-K factor RskA
MSDEAHVTEYIPAYALDCLDQDEMAQVSQHLASCPLCQGELEAYRDIADRLACVAPDVEPSDGLKQRLMARVQPPHPAPARVPWWQQVAHIVRRTAPVWGTVAVALAIVLAVSNLWLLNQAERAKEMRTIALLGTEDAPDAIGTIIVSTDGDHGAIVVDGLDPLDAAHQYQVWLIKDGQRTSGGVFSVDEDGYGVLWLSSPQSLASYDAVGITVEPAGGSPGPTGIKVLGGNL